MRTVLSGVKCLQMLLFLQGGPVQIMYGTFRGMADLCSILDNEYLSIGVIHYLLHVSFVKNGCIYCLISGPNLVYYFSPTLDICFTFRFQVLSISSAKYSASGTFFFFFCGY